MLLHYLPVCCIVQDWLVSLYCSFVDRLIFFAWKPVWGLFLNLWLLPYLYSTTFSECVHIFYFVSLFLDQDNPSICMLWSIFSHVHCEHHCYSLLVFLGLPSKLIFPCMSHLLFGISHPFMGLDFLPSSAPVHPIKVYTSIFLSFYPVPPHKKLILMICSIITFSVFGLTFNKPNISKFSREFGILCLYLAEIHLEWHRIFVLILCMFSLST